MILDLLASPSELDVRSLKLLQELLGAHARPDQVDREADVEHELLEEGQLNGGELVERTELDDAAQLIFEEHRKKDDVARPHLAEARGDLAVVLGDVGDDDWLPLERALADQSLTQREAIREVLPLHVGVRARQLERRLLSVSL